jgi:hypothetical protein
VIIPDHKIVFVHIPKTAGMAITHMILPHLVGRETSGEIGRLSDEVKIAFSLRGKQKHKQGRFYLSDGDISQKNWDECYKFAVVRNPWDRAVSEFVWRHTLPTRHPSTDFSQFLRYCEARIKDYRCGGDIYWPHAQLQESFVTDGGGKVILDEVFRFEKLSCVVETLRAKMNLPFGLRKLNDTPHSHYRQYYNKDTREFVRRLYANDIERFGYEF